MVAMKKDRVGFLAVSLGYFKTLFSPPSHSTSSEIPKDTQDAMGLDPAMVRISVGLDHEIGRTWRRLSTSLDAVLGPRKPA
jgi:methionine-gamma-lyase